MLELDLDLDLASRASPGSPGSGDNRDGGWRPPHRLSLLSSGSHCSSRSSGIEADSQLAEPMEPGEMSVDEPVVGAAALHGEEPPSSSRTSQSSRGTVGGGSGGPEGDTRDQGEGECAAWLDAGWVIAVGAGRGWGARHPDSGDLVTQGPLHHRAWEQRREDRALPARRGGWWSFNPPAAGNS